jgi:hypothetical protein
MSTTTTRTSQKQQLRNQFAFNQKFIETACELNAEEYQQTLFEFGCQFLENKYDRSTQFGEDEYQYLCSQSFYWTWWSREFNLFINRQIQSDLDWYPELWYAIIPTMLESSIVKKGFVHQLKTV